jgi:hypothetical protein
MNSTAQSDAPGKGFFSVGLVLEAIGVWAICFGLSGCAALPLSALGTVAGAAGTAFSTGQEIYSLGKLDTAERATFEESLAAARLAAEDFGMATVPQPPPCCTRDGTVVEQTFKDDKGGKIAVRVERRAPKLVLIRVDVGIFGSEPIAHIFMADIRTHLPAQPSETRPSKAKE